ncbi:hypothetical protein J437_LFUL013993 [Ladona fulva]|uniref:protein-tyrosine-phosphatase n=1 Tax=Ladona fulva TaxID=123851 RepID=A0A8K0KH61_LADFU|nr:hypothetical protein J437_LFUL013993 [Ladona fulva]
MERRMRANTAILLGLLAALLPWLPSCPARISAADLPPPLPRGANSTEDSPDSAFNNSGGASTNSVQGPSKAESRPVAGSPPLEGNCTTFGSCGNEPRNTSIPEGTVSHPEGTVSHPEGAPQAPLPVNGGSDRRPEEEGNGLEAPGFAGNNAVPKDSDLPETNNTLTSKAVTGPLEVPSSEPPLTSSRGRSIGGNEANHVVFADTEDSLESADARVLAKEEERGKGGVREEHDGGMSVEDEGEEGGTEGNKRTSEDDLSYHFKEFSRVEFAERDESTVAYVTEKATHVHFSSSKVVSEVYDSDDVVLTSPVTAPSGPEDDHEDEEEEMMEGEAGERSDLESMFTVLPTTGRTPTQIPLNQTHESGNDVTIPSESVIMHINDSSLAGSDVSTSENRATNCTSDECRLTNAIPDSISFVTMAPSTTERAGSGFSSTNHEQSTTSNNSYIERSTTRSTPMLITSTTKTLPSSMSSIAKSTRRIPISTTESPIKNEVTYNENITALTYDLKANISLTTPISVKFASSHSSSIQNTLPLTTKTISTPMPTAGNASESSGTTTHSTGFEYPVTESTTEQYTTNRGMINITSTTITSGSTITAANGTTMGNSELEETTLASEGDISENVTSSVTDSELTTFPTTFHQDQETELLIKSMSSTMDSSTESMSFSDNVTVEMTTEMQEEKPKVNDLEKIVSATYASKSSSSDISESISTPEITTVVPDGDTNVSSAGGTLPVEEEETKVPLVTLTESSEVSGTPGGVEKIVNHIVSSQSPEISTVENANVSSETTEFSSSVTPATTVALMLNRTSPLPSAETHKVTDDEESTKAYKPDDKPAVNDTDVLIRAYPAFVRLWMKISWNEICQEQLQTSLKEAVSKLLSKSTHRTIPTSRVVLLNFDENCSSSSVGSTRSLSPVYFCILAMTDGDQMEQKHESSNEEGKLTVHCDSMLTELFSRIWTQTPEPLVEPLKHIKEVDIVQSNWSADDGMEFPPNPSEDNSGIIAAIGISCVAAVCLLLIGALLLIMRKRQTRFNYGQRCTPVSLDAYSLDSVSVREGSRPGRGQVRNGEVSRGTNGLRKGDGANDWRASKRSYGNPAFEDDDGEEVLLSKPLNFAALTNAALNEEGSLTDEFGLIPKKFHKSSMRRKSRRRNREASVAERGESIEVEEDKDEEGLPEGAEEKNRYANVVPTLSTRVKLSAKSSGSLSTYINANYCRGHKNQEKFYIACQAPLSSTIEDFWRMIWEQQSKVILMLTNLVENGVEKCADYLPPSEVLDCHRLFGDYQVTLKKRDVREKYIVSSLQLKDMESNLWREVTHLWFLGWPATGVPEEPNQIIAFLIEARPYIQANTGPTVVHCSPGTGRTGTVIAIDICIRDFEQNRMVDVPKVVQQLRRDREGSVQTQQQYAFIYETLSLYATKLTGGAMDSF